MTKNRSTKIKAPKNKNLKVPEVLRPEDRIPATLSMDGTSHVEISQMQNVYYSKEIIEETRGHPHTHLANHLRDLQWNPEMGSA